LRQIVQQNQQLVVKVVHRNGNGPSIVGHLAVASGSGRFVIVSSTGQLAVISGVGHLAVISRSGRFVIVSSVGQLAVISGVGHLAVISRNEHIFVFSGVGHLASVSGEALNGVKGVLIYRSKGGCRFCVGSAKYKNNGSDMLFSNLIMYFIMYLLF
jgi:hypothetical protein